MVKRGLEPTVGAKDGTGKTKDAINLHREQRNPFVKSELINCTGK